MRVSAGCFVIALSGKMRTQSLPPFFRWREIVTRDDSIWRAVTHFGSRALRPNSPNARLTPRFAGPLMRGWLCGLRYLTRLGISILASPFRRGSGGRRLAGLDRHRGRDERRFLLGHLL